MKSASEWLASSDEEDVVRKKPTPQKPSGIRRKSRSPSPNIQPLSIPESDSPNMARARDAAAARQREADERRRKQEELRERMKATLGTDVVDAITTTATADRKLPPSVFTSEDSTASGTHPAGVMSSAYASGVLPPTGGGAGLRSSEELKRRSNVPDHLEEVDIMLADRGTQTVEHSECQTDPEPRVLHCGQCYYDYYGHAPELPTCPHGSDYLHGAANNAYSYASAAGGGDPIFAALMQRASAPRRVAAAPYGKDAAGPQGGLFGAVQCASLLKEQLNAVQASIDMLISRYNLPPPPGMEYLAVGRGM